MQTKELQNLNNINRVGKRGIYKISLYKSNVHYFRACDYMKKINYCIQDLNTVLFFTVFHKGSISRITPSKLESNYFR